MTSQVEQTAISDPRVVEWQLSHEGREYCQSAEYAILEDTTDLLVVTGFGETNVKTIVQLLGERGIQAAVCNISYPDKIDSKDLAITPDLMEQTILKSISAIIIDINVQAKRQINTPLFMVGHSKGFGELLKFASTYPSACARLSGAAPLGANCVPEIMGADAKEYRRNFSKRLRASELLSPANARADVGQLLNEFKIGMQYVQREDCRGMVKQLAKLGILRHVVVGEFDAFCPPDECRQVIGNDVEIVVTEGKHDNVTSPLGLNQLVAAINSCYSI